MTASDAAVRLDAALRKFRWYLSTGVAATPSKTWLIVYVKTARHPELRDALSKGWKGYEVRVAPVGGVRAAKAADAAV